ncbi:hypothetical protein N7541_002380 [Penicillium brevicompactum]|uniref:Uncharacterized protein n=1 Tax=Penicillium brevicompactum TaxID=5074 RepID=A0A9W9RK76_PENBR|nr:hypothetical protein N7541_002380 [Penicillium brevicompactum]
MSLLLRRSMPKVSLVARTRSIPGRPILAPTTTAYRALLSTQQSSPFTSKASDPNKSIQTPTARPGPKTTDTSTKVNSSDGTSGPGDAGFEPDMPTASLESLGIGRNMKVFLFVVLGVFGSIETWFWVKAFWIWWKKDADDLE